MFLKLYLNNVILHCKSVYNKNVSSMPCYNTMNVHYIKFNKMLDELDYYSLSYTSQVWRPLSLSELTQILLIWSLLT